MYGFAFDLVIRARWIAEESAGSFPLEVNTAEVQVARMGASVFVASHIWLLRSCFVGSLCWAHFAAHFAGLCHPLASEPLKDGLWLRWISQQQLDPFLENPVLVYLAWLPGPLASSFHASPACLLMMAKAIASLTVMLKDFWCFGKVGFFSPSYSTAQTQGDKKPNPEDKSWVWGSGEGDKFLTWSIQPLPRQCGL